MRLLTVMMFAGVLAAQGPGGPRAQGPASMEELKAYLGLTDSQVELIRQATRSFRESTRTQMREMAEKRRAIREQIEAGSAEATGQLASEMATLRKQIRSRQEVARGQALAALTPDQKAKLAALEEAAGRERLLRQAQAANLIAPTEGMPPGPGPGFGRMGGRGRFGPPRQR
jgi:Spy/CpxP family protein refolding chaperone